MSIRFSLYFFLPILVGIILSSCSKKEIRVRSDFGESWKFSLNADSIAAHMPGFNDSAWRSLDIPHDWSIEGEFSETNPATAGGGALPGGIGWYRKSFILPEIDSAKIFYIDFDGVYRNSEVWINGQYLGKRPYGYSSFRYNLTPWLHFRKETNVVAVKVDNSKQPNSRWYSGSGIYRNVWLVKTGKVHVDHWGTQVLSPAVSEKIASISIKTLLRNTTSTPVDGILETRIMDQNGASVLKQKTKFKLPGDTTSLVKQDFTLNNPVLWTLDKPAMYKAISKVIISDHPEDEYETPFGIRSFVFDRDSGFILNGIKTKILGVCNHHDLGCFGAAINIRALERQLDILKDMGCNAIRTSHNPPAPELLDLCDKMGFVVMDEAFDMWKKQKNANDYHLDWDEWHKRDLQDMILRDRNHPSVMIWSIGNEIGEQWDSTGIPIARELAGYVRELDTTRPITSGCNETRPINNIIRSGVLDIIGYNYHQNEYADFKNTFSKGAFIASETTSALATRGYYEMNSDSIRRWPVRWDVPFKGNEDNTCSSYDNCSTPWGSTHEETWRVIKKYDFLSGMFIWTGFDYLGEPTPYGWPSRSSYFGVIDLAGFPKDAFYMYKSEWTKASVIHLFPHWNWNEGDSVDMWVYTNCKEVELLLNGNSLGIKKKGPEDLHLQWRVQYKPGEVKAIGRTDGNEDISAIVKTAGKAARIKLVSDRNTIQANGKDLSFITVRVLDEAGTLVPDAENRVKFTVKGDGTIAGVDNGDPVSHESFRADSRKAFHGLCLVVVKAGKAKGSIEVIAESEGLVSASTELRSK
jgi:beta-galactosidase